MTGTELKLENLETRVRDLERTRTLQGVSLVLLGAALVAHLLRAIL